MMLRKRGAHWWRLTPRTEQDRCQRYELAPLWHTVLLVVWIAAVALIGLGLAVTGHPIELANGPATGSRLKTMYLPLLVSEWSLVGYVALIGRPSLPVLQWVGKTWDTPRRAGTNLAWGLFVAASIVFIEAAYNHLFGTARPSSGAALLPHTVTERLVWGAVAASVAFCEELVYRGYLQTQLSAYGRSLALGVAVQAILFGIAHGEQGWAAAVRMSLYALVLGILAASRKSLIPGMIAHFAIDLGAGLFND